MLKTALAAIAVFTAAASCWLFVMYFVLKHPGYEWRAALAALFVAQSVLTLVLVASGKSGRPALLESQAGRALGRLRSSAAPAVPAGFGASVLMSLKFNTVLNSMLNSPKFCQR